MLRRRNSSLMSAQYIFDLMRRGNNISFHVEKKKSSHLSPVDDVFWFLPQSERRELYFVLPEDKLS